MPEGMRTSGGPSNANAVPSPDGRSIVFLAATPTGENAALWIRPMDSSESHRLTDAGALPFWSPDSRFIAFFSSGKLMKISAAGGPAIPVCDLPQGDAAPQGGTWNASGVIVFASGEGPLLRVLAAGGVPTPATTFDAAAGEISHEWPQFLPDGRHLLYFANVRDIAKRSRAVYVQELGSSKRVLVMQSRARAAWSPPGYLLFPRDGALFAQRMDPNTFQLTGDPALVADGVNAFSAGRVNFSVSPAGVLVFRGDASARTRQLAWYSRDGKRLDPVGQPGDIGPISLSPDEKSVAFSAGASGHFDTFVMDVAGGVQTSMTKDGNSRSMFTPWSPDSQRLAIARVTVPGLVELTVASGGTRPSNRRRSLPWCSGIGPRTAASCFAPIRRSSTC